MTTTDRERRLQLIREASARRQRGRRLPASDPAQRHCPPGYELAFQVMHACSREEAIAEAKKVLQRKAHLKLAAGWYDTGGEYHPEGWMVFRPIAGLEGVA